MTPNRIHLICHANPIQKDVDRFGFPSLAAYLRSIRASLSRGWRLTCSDRLLAAAEDPDAGGRNDDAARIRDLNRAIADPRTWGIVAAAGGAYFSRILPELDLSPLAHRKEPFFAFGFSEMTCLVNLVASYRCGRGFYWLCPNYIAWKVSPPERARELFGEFWRRLPHAPASHDSDPDHALSFRPIRGRLAFGRIPTGRVRFVGGCLSVLAATITGSAGRRIRFRDRWLLIEDVNEAPHRIDRALAALRLAGCFDQVAGVLVGDFHTREQRQSAQVVEFLRVHLRRRPHVPIVVTADVGHVWPIAPVPLNRAMHLERGRSAAVSFTP